MSHYSCLRELTLSITEPSSFPPRGYWRAASDRRIRFSDPARPPRARLLSDPVPSHVFQVPCDTVSSSDSCFQSNRQLNLVR